MAKAVPTGFSYALNHFGAQWLQSLEVGYTVQYAHTVSQRLQHFYGKIEYFLQQLKFTPLEFCTYTTGLDLSNEISKVFSSEEKKSSQEWEEIISKLSLKSQIKDETPFHAGVWSRIFDDVQVMYGVEPEHIRSVTDKVKKAIENPKRYKEELCGKPPLNFVKVTN